MFSWFKSKTVSLEQLQKYVLKKNLKEWNSRLEIILNAVKKAANEGKTNLLIPDNILRCQYNMNRKREDILMDFQKRFKKCNVFFNSVNGQTTIEIRW